jgi:hypothetical protein
MVRAGVVLSAIYMCCNATNSSLQEVWDGVVPSEIEVFIEYHRGPDPLNPDQLYSQSTMNCLVSFYHFLIFCTIVLSPTCIADVFGRINMANKW